MAEDETIRVFVKVNPSLHPERYEGFAPSPSWRSLVSLLAERLQRIRCERI